MVYRDLARQTQQAFMNLREVLETAGTLIGQLLYVRVFFKKGENPEKVAQFCRDCLDCANPAVTFVEVDALAGDFYRIEVEGIALLA